MEQTIVMTGASRGIGRIAAERIIAKEPGTRLVVLARGPVDDLTTMSGKVSVICTDLASMRSTADAAAEVMRRLDAGVLPPMKALVCNAGVQYTNNLTETVDGIEATFAVNVLANHILVRALGDRLGSPGRIVMTVSDTHFGDFRHNLGMVPGPRWFPADALARIGVFPAPERTMAGRTAYSTSKLAVIYLVHEYARRLPPGVAVMGYNPGFVPGTDLARDADMFSRFAMRRIMPFLTATPLATSPSAAGRYLAAAALGAIDASSGAYIDRNQVAQSSSESYNLERERDTWNSVEALTAAW
ncbi:SDR family NAD(P)-dependent oxidoreductase [Arthrobacter sp. EpRS71]|uniref:SDR family NAD(P)-dependent oxidoreductase n=1 Tax=Arthrobacter sp. EpRS71 TaxID=1743141 RepID=UPI000749BDFE|nr:SDR family NAD(P)-dependent oxidoreductase [Arthrobacter sp. EpRS71]KUM35607.1 short-chain dehydrogenase [Arthrobacter sp. EpRS71]